MADGGDGVEAWHDGQSKVQSVWEEWVTVNLSTKLNFDLYALPEGDGLSNLHC